jgi:hypothetical protein
MGVLSWWRKRKREQEREGETIAQMRRDEESDTPMPAETYLSQARD